jgi:hypothetical protein
VVIKRPEEWAVGAAKAFSGMVGTVESIRKSGSICVRFDSPPPTWREHQTPPNAHHFDHDELELEHSHAPKHCPLGGTGYQVCECGATRRASNGQVAGDWHACSLCVAGWRTAL